jgi:hypothetical protein
MVPAEIPDVSTRHPYRNINTESTIQECLAKRKEVSRERQTLPLDLFWCLHGNFRELFALTWTKKDWFSFFEIFVPSTEDFLI